jgi:transcriptional antiterminator RfaH
MTDTVETGFDDTRWFAVWTRSRQEKTAEAMLQLIGVDHYLPMKSELRQWSDRKKTVSSPLFSGYLFVRVNATTHSRLQVLKVPGVAGIVGNSRGPLPIPDQQIQDIRTILARRVEFTVIPILKEGDRVRVVRGSLIGVEGRLLQRKSSSHLINSVETLHMSIVVNLSSQDVMLIGRSASQLDS